MARKTKKTTPKTPRTTRPQKPKEAIAPRQGKPMFRLGTWVTILILALLIGAVYYLNQQPDDNSGDTAELDMFTFEEPALLFTADAAVNSIEVKPTDGETVRLERGTENAWALTLPFKTEADPGLAEAAASQLAALSIVDEVENPDPSVFGLDNPSYTITIAFADGSTSTLEVGDATPSNSGYYVRVDKENIVILNLSGIDALTNLAAFPPYLNTPTPTATATPPPTETPVPPTQSDSTPEATSTP